MKRLFSICTLLLALCTGLCAQKTIKGKVVDDQSEPLTGVAIVVLGNFSRGTVTDLDGNYSIVINESDTLRYSYLGFVSQLIPAMGKMQIDVVLNAEKTEIDEIVVTAMGIKQQKKKIGYATQQVNKQAIEQSAPINMGSALSGQVAGLAVTNPTGIFQKPEFTLRGKKPLIVLDGIPIESDLYDVASSDIESVNVLKGTSASALYGARGKDGAVLITTKRAKKDGLEVDISLSSMISAGFTVYPKTQNEYGSGSAGKYEFWDGADGGISDGAMVWGPKFSDHLLIPQWNSPIRNKQTGETLPWWGDVVGSVYDNRALYERVPIPFEPHNNLKEFLQTGIITKGSFSISNRTDKGNTYVSGNVSRQKGQVPNTSLNTGGLTFNGNYQLAKNITFSPKLSYNKVYSPSYPRSGYGPRNHIYTILLWMGDNVDIRDLRSHIYRQDMMNVKQANFNYAWYNNPYFMTEELAQRHDRDVITAQGALNWDILPHLSLQGRSSYRLDDSFDDMSTPKSYLNYGDSREGGYSNTNQKNMDLNSDVRLSYTTAFSKNFNFTLNTGASVFYRKMQSEFQTTDGLIVPLIYNLGNSKGPVKATNNVQERAINSLYASLNLDLFQSVFLTFTGRNDWASTLPKENSSYFYPSVAASTMVSDYIHFPKAVDYVKAYSSWAQVSSDLAPYSLYSTYNNSTPYGSAPAVTYPSNIVNKNIKSQQSNSFEFGLSTAFVKNRIMLDVTYYRVLDVNQIIELPISETSGFLSRKVNGNQYTTHGLEIVLGTKLMDKKNFAWNLNTNWYTGKRKLTSIYGGQKTYQNLKVGDRADAIYTTQWQRSSSGELILDSKGMPVANASLTNIGGAEVDWRFGFQNSFKIHKFKVNMNIDGAIGGNLISLTHKKLWWGGKHPNSVMHREEEYKTGAPVFVADGVVVTGGKLVQDLNGNTVSDTRTYAKNTQAVSFQDWCQTYTYTATVTYKEDPFFANTFSRSFIKLRQLSVSYDFASLLSSPKIKALEVSVYGNNLMVLSKMPLLDPDFGPSDGGLQDPSARYVGMSATLKF